MGIKPCSRSSYVGTGPGDLSSVHRGSITHAYGRGELPGSNTKGENKMKTYENRESFLKLPVLSSEAHRFPVPITLKTTGQCYMLTYINHAPMTDIF